MPIRFVDFLFDTVQIFPWRDFSFQQSFIFDGFLMDLLKEYMKKITSFLKGWYFQLLEWEGMMFPLEVNITPSYIRR